MESNVQKKCYFALNSLKMIGYFESQLLSKLYGAVYFTIALIILLGEIVAFVNRDTIQERIEIIYTTNGILFAMVFYVKLKKHHEMLHQFLSAISKSHATIDDLRLEALELTATKAGYIIPKLVMILVGILTPILTAWCFTPFLRGFDYNNKNFYAIPYLFQCTDNGDNRFPIKILCTEKNSFLEFFFFNSLVTVLGTCGVLAYLVWLFSFLVCICIFIRANIRVIKRQLQVPSSIELRCNIHCVVQNSNADRIEESTLLAEEENVALRGHLIKVIQYHQYLYR